MPVTVYHRNDKAVVSAQFGALSLFVNCSIPFRLFFADSVASRACDGVEEEADGYDAEQ